MLSSPSFKFRHSAHLLILQDMQDNQWPWLQYCLNNDADHHLREGRPFYSILSKPQQCQLQDLLCLVQMSYLPSELFVVMSYPYQHSKHICCYPIVCHITLLSHRTVSFYTKYTSLSAHLLKAWLAFFLSYITRPRFVTTFFAALRHLPRSAIRVRGRDSYRCWTIGRPIKHSYFSQMKQVIYQWIVNVARMVWGKARSETGLCALRMNGTTVSVRMALQR